MVISDVDNDDSWWLMNNHETLPLSVTIVLSA